MTLSWPDILEGFMLGLSLIIPIGTQNAYLLRQGTLGRHPYLAACVCGVCDSLLIIAGGLGVGALLSENVWLRTLAVIGGVAFLSYYGYKAARGALTPYGPSGPDPDLADNSGPRQVIYAAIAFSLLNPHAILDATVLIGGIAAQKEPMDVRIAFVIGTVIASWVWFCSLAFFATLLRPLFRKPMAARILDGLVALLMFTIAIMLVWSEFLTLS